MTDLAGIPADQDGRDGLGAQKKSNKSDEAGGTEH